LDKTRSISKNIQKKGRTSIHTYYKKIQNIQELGNKDGVYVEDPRRYDKR